MKNPLFLVILLALSPWLFFSCNAPNKDKTNSQIKDKPNILIIVADDLGFGDVGFHGSDIKTPNIDRIAKDGVELDNFYSCPMCSPTRAGLMTGRYPLRFGLMRAVVPPYRVFGLSTEEETIAEMVEKAGYSYRGITGKWHLGHHQQKWLPTNRGFTFFEGCHNGAIDYFTHIRNGEPDWHENDQPSSKQGYSTDLIGQAAVGFIESVPENEPFFLYVPFNAPHSPFQAKPEDIAKYPEREGDRQIYAGMVDCMDQNIGKIIKCIEDREQLGNTFILFFSDNGGVLRVASNGNLRGAKLTPFQGGIRVAAAAMWKDGGVSGGKVIEELMGYIDVFPTIMEVSNSNGIPVNELDGINVLPAMKGEKLNNRSWYTYFDQSNARAEKLAINNNDWKLVLERNAPDAEDVVGDTLLFQIATDPYEETDLAGQYPNEVEFLLNELYQFYELKSQYQVARYSDRSKQFGESIPYWQPAD
jgi:arylsulfatase B